MYDEGYAAGKKAGLSEYYGTGYKVGYKDGRTSGAKDASASVVESQLRDLFTELLARLDRNEPLTGYDEYY
jgi:flagellar biosynthesis/type III secretory pathway protein FliH